MVSGLGPNIAAFPDSLALVLSDHRMKFLVLLECSYGRRTRLARETLETRLIVPTLDQKIPRLTRKERQMRLQEALEFETEVYI